MTRPSVLDVLKRAHALLAEGPHRWTQGTFARDVGGRPVYTTESTASCFCARGAIRRVPGDIHTKLEAQCALAYAVPDIPNTRGVCVIVNYNDNAGTTHQDILNLFKAAIAAEEKR